MEAFACDDCKLLIDQGKQKSCYICNEEWHNDDGYNVPERHYHKSCITALSSKYFCKKHHQAMNDARVIIGYARKFWQDLGVEVEFEGKVADRLNVDLCGLELRVDIKPKFNDRTKELEAIEYSIIGLRKADRDRDEHKKHKVVFVAGIHDHDSALQKLRAMLVGSLRSKKSAATQAIRAIARKLAGEEHEHKAKIDMLDTLITTIENGGNNARVKGPNV